MKLIVFALSTALFFSACGRLGAKTETSNTAANTSSANAAAPAEEGKFKTGDTVVARWMKNSYYEGIVEDLQANKAKIKWSDGSNPTDVELVDVYPLPKAGAKPDVKQDDMVLAKVSSQTYWSIARITEIKDGVYVVRLTDDGSTHNMPAEKIIKLNAAASADAVDKAVSPDIMKEVQSKKPVIPSNFAPKVGDKVLGEWAPNSWWSGKVTKVEGGKATVAWDDGSTPREVGEGKVLPLPDANAKQPKMPAKGQFLLVKPETGTKWAYAKTEDVSDGSVKVRLSDGKERTVKPGDFILLN